MSTPTIVKAGNLSLKNIVFSDVKVDQHGRKMIFVNQNSQKILIQTPKMSVPNGIKKWRKPDAVNNKDDKFEVELSFAGENVNDKNGMELTNMHNKFKEFDDIVKNKIIEKSKEWLGMPKLDMTTVESVMYTPMVKISKDKDGNVLPYPSRVKAKIDREMDTHGNPTGKFMSNKKYKTEVQIYDENKERLIFNENNAEDIISKGSQVICILELVYLSIVKTTISAKWKLIQAKVYKNKDSITSYALIDDDEEENNGNNEIPEDLDTCGSIEHEEVHEEVHEEMNEEVQDEIKEITNEFEDLLKPKSKKKNK